MGQLLYASQYEVSFDDRTLAHLQVVITAKLRRNEPFTFSWAIAAENGSGRTSIWLHPSISLVYSYHGSRMPEINRVWIEQLMQSANSGGGLRMVPEPNSTTD